MAAAPVPFLIPLAPGTAQTLSVVLDGVNFQLVVRWNDTAGCWNFDLNDGNGNPILQNIPMVTGADLLAQFKYLLIDGQLVVQTTNDARAIPTFQNLGATGNLYFVTSS